MGLRVHQDDYFYIPLHNFISLLQIICKDGSLFARFNITCCQYLDMLLHDSHHCTYKHKHQVLGSQLERMEMFLI